MIRLALQAKKPIPPEIVNAPELSENNVLTWLCFKTLRRGGDDLVALRWVDVLLWCNTYGCSLQHMEGVQEGIAILDAVWLPYFRAKAKANKPKG